MTTNQPHNENRQQGSGAAIYWKFVRAKYLLLFFGRASLFVGISILPQLFQFCNWLEERQNWSYAEGRNLHVIEASSRAEQTQKLIYKLETLYWKNSEDCTILITAIVIQDIKNIFVPTKQGQVPIPLPMEARLKKYYSLVENTI